MRRAWTNQELEILAARYPTEGASPELCSVLGRNRGAVAQYARTHGIKHERYFRMETLDDIKAQCVMDGDCWVWQRHHNKDGPRTWYREGDKWHSMAVRRLAYWWQSGSRPRRTIVIRGTCGDASCVNPAHSEAITQARHLSEAAQRSHTPEVHRKMAESARKTRARLTWESVQDIRLSDKTNAALAEKYDVSAQTIGRVRRHETWRDYSNPWQQMMR